MYTDHSVTLAMTTLTEIEHAVDSLSREDREELLRFLSRRLRSEESSAQRATVVRNGADVLLAAAADAPPMTPEHVRSLLDNRP
jgi:hypothetical protein